MRDTGLENVVWPAFRFGTPNCTVLRYDDPAGLTKASTRTLEVLRRMQEYFLVDSSGRRYDLENPEFVDLPSAPFRVLSYLAGTTRPIRYQLKDCRLIAVEDVKQLVFQNFADYEDYWQEYELDELRRRLKEARTMGEVMAVFGPSKSPPLR